MATRFCPPRDVHPSPPATFTSGFNPRCSHIPYLPRPSKICRKLAQHCQETAFTVPVVRAEYPLVHHYVEAVLAMVHTAGYQPRPALTAGRFPPEAYPVAEHVQSVPSTGS